MAREPELSIRVNVDPTIDRDKFQQDINKLVPESNPIKINGAIDAEKALSSIADYQQKSGKSVPIVAKISNADKALETAFTNHEATPLSVTIAESSLKNVKEQLQGIINGLDFSKLNGAMSNAAAKATPSAAVPKTVKQTVEQTVVQKVVPDKTVQTKSTNTSHKTKTDYDPLNINTSKFDRLINKLNKTEEPYKNAIASTETLGYVTDETRKKIEIMAKSSDGYIRQIGTTLTNVVSQIEKSGSNIINVKNSSQFSRDLEYLNIASEHFGGKFLDYNSLLSNDATVNDINKLVIAVDGYNNAVDTIIDLNHEASALQDRILRKVPSEIKSYKDLINISKQWNTLRALNNKTGMDFDTFDNGEFSILEKALPRGAYNKFSIEDYDEWTKIKSNPNTVQSIASFVKILGKVHDIEVPEIKLPENIISEVKEKEPTQVKIDVTVDPQQVQEEIKEAVAPTTEAKPIPISVTPDATEDDIAALKKEIEDGINPVMVVPDIAPEQLDALKGKVEGALNTVKFDPVPVKEEAVTIENAAPVEEPKKKSTKKKGKITPEEAGWLSFDSPELVVPKEEQKPVDLLGKVVLTKDDVTPPEEPVEIPGHVTLTKDDITVPDKIDLNGNLVIANATKEIKAATKEAEGTVAEETDKKSKKDDKAAKERKKKEYLNSLGSLLKRISRAENELDEMYPGAPDAIEMSDYITDLGHRRDTTKDLLTKLTGNTDWKNDSLYTSAKSDAEHIRESKTIGSKVSEEIKNGIKEENEYKKTLKALPELEEAAANALRDYGDASEKYRVANEKLTKARDNVSAFENKYGETYSDLLRNEILERQKSEKLMAQEEADRKAKEEAEAAANKKRIEDERQYLKELAQEPKLHQDMLDMQRKYGDNDYRTQRAVEDYNKNHASVDTFEKSLTTQKRNLSDIPGYADVVEANKRSWEDWTQGVQDNSAAKRAKDAKDAADEERKNISEYKRLLKEKYDYQKKISEANKDTDTKAWENIVKKDDTKLTALKNTLQKNQDVVDELDLIEKSYVTVAEDRDNNALGKAVSKQQSDYIKEIVSDYKTLASLQNKRSSLFKPEDADRLKDIDEAIQRITVSMRGTYDQARKSGFDLNANSDVEEQMKNLAAATKISNREFAKNKADDWLANAKKDINEAKDTYISAQKEIDKLDEQAAQTHNQQTQNDIAAEKKLWETKRDNAEKQIDGYLNGNADKYATDANNEIDSFLNRANIKDSIADEKEAADEERKNITQYEKLLKKKYDLQKQIADAHKNTDTSAWQQQLSDAEAEMQSLYQGFNWFAKNEVDLVEGSYKAVAANKDNLANDKKEADYVKEIVSNYKALVSLKNKRPALFKPEDADRLNDIDNAINRVKNNIKSIENEASKKGFDLTGNKDISNAEADFARASKISKRELRKKRSKYRNDEAAKAQAVTDKENNDLLTDYNNQLQKTLGILREIQKIDQNQSPVNYADAQRKLAESKAETARLGTEIKGKGLTGSSDFIKANTEYVAGYKNLQEDIKNKAADDALKDQTATLKENTTLLENYNRELTKQFNLYKDLKKVDPNNAPEQAARKLAFDNQKAVVDNLKKQIIQKGLHTDPAYLQRNNQYLMDVTGFDKGQDISAANTAEDGLDKQVKNLRTLLKEKYDLMAKVFKSEDNTDKTAWNKRIAEIKTEVEAGKKALVQAGRQADADTLDSYEARLKASSDDMLNKSANNSIAKAQADYVKDITSQYSQLESLYKRRISLFKPDQADNLRDIDDEIKRINADLAKTYAEAKQNGYDLTGNTDIQESIDSLSRQKKISKRDFAKNQQQYSDAQQDAYAAKASKEAAATKKENLDLLRQYNQSLNEELKLLKQVYIAETSEEKAAAQNALNDQKNKTDRLRNQIKSKGLDTTSDYQKYNTQNALNEAAIKTKYSNANIEDLKNIYIKNLREREANINAAYSTEDADKIARITQRIEDNNKAIRESGFALTQFGKKANDAWAEISKVNDELDIAAEQKFNKALETENKRADTQAKKTLSENEKLLNRIERTMRNREKAYESWGSSEAGSQDAEAKKGRFDTQTTKLSGLVQEATDRGLTTTKEYLDLQEQHKKELSSIMEAQQKRAEAEQEAIRVQDEDRLSLLNYIKTVEKYKDTLEKDDHTDSSVYGDSVSMANRATDLLDMLNKNPDNKNQVAYLWGQKYNIQGVTDLQSAFKALAVDAAKAGVKVQDLRTETEKLRSELQNKTNIANLQSQLSDYLAKFPKVESGLADEVQKLQKALADPNAYQQAGKLKLAMAELRAHAKALGLESENLLDKFKNLFGQHLSTMITMAALHKMQDALRVIYQNVVEIDTAVTELRKVSEYAGQSLEEYMGRAAEQAQKLGVTISEYVNSTADWKRLGYSDEDAENLATYSTLLRNVGDGIDDVNTSSSYLISTLKGFGLLASDAENVVNMIDSVANTQPVTANDLGEILTRSSAAMSAANNTLGETLALGSAANAVLQDADSTGTMLKSLSMYLRAAKSDLEAAGESADGCANSVSELRSELKSLTGVDIMSDAAGKNFKSTYQIMKELSEVWDSLSDVTQANVTEMIAGKRNANGVAAILNGFDIAESTMESAANSSNVAWEENQRFLDSVQGRLAQLDASFQALSEDVLSSDLIKSGVSFLTSVVQLLDKIVNLTGALPAAVGIGAFATQLGEPKMTGFMIVPSNTPGGDTEQARCSFYWCSAAREYLVKPTNMDAIT